MGNRTSYKFLVQQTGDNHYTLPARDDMKVPVYAYLSEDLFRTSEEEAWNQVADAVRYEGLM